MNRLPQKKKPGDPVLAADWNTLLDAIAARTPMADHHPDAKEGVAAFREKRSPRFNAWLEE